MNDAFKIGRATIVNHSPHTHMPPRRRGVRRKRGSGGGGASTVRLSKGRVVIKVGGFPGTQKIPPALLIRKIAKKHIRKAASSVLRSTKKKFGGGGTSGKKKGKQRKSRGRPRRSKRKRSI